MRVAGLGRFSGLPKAGSRVAQVIGVLVLSVTNLAAQYTAQFLPPPVDQPALNMGQVFGRAINNTSARAPVLWTNGVGMTLPVPAGYHWDDSGGSTNFALNDSGTVAALVQSNNPALGNRIAVWNNGAPTLLPLPPNCTGVAGLNGMNRAGHILGSAGSNLGGGACSSPGGMPEFWIWNGSSFEIIPQPAGVPGCLDLAYLIGNSSGGRALNDADHAAMYQYWVENLGGCSIPNQEQPLIFTPPAGINFLPPIFSSSVQINNQDQMVVSLSGSGNDVQFWDGAAFHDLGIDAGAYLNNAKQVVYTVQDLQMNIWQSGASAPIALPAVVLDPHVFPGIAGFNDSGQIALNAGSGPYLLSPSGACGQDVTSQVQVTRGGFRLNRTTQHFTQIITVTNTGVGTIAGPMSVALDGVPAAASLFGIAGATLCQTPQGSPYLNAPDASLAPGASTTLTLDFIDTANAGITYSTRVLAGSGGR
jgi:hypothetical protein